MAAVYPPVDQAAAVPSLRTLGTGAQQALPGNTVIAPSGPAGGVLDGTYPDPGLAAAVAGAGLAETADVLSVNVDGSTLAITADTLGVKALGITDAQVAAANKDGAAGTASMRTLGTGAQQALPGNTSLSSVVARGRALYGGVKQFSIPGVYPVGIATFTGVAGRAMYFPFLVDTSITIDQIACELTTGVAASTSRACIYPADTDWQPGTMVANTDTGAFNTTAAQVGVIATGISDTVLAAGRYLFWLNCSTGNPVFRSIRSGTAALLGYPVAMGANTGFIQIYIAQAYAGSPPGAGLAWTTVTVGGPQSFDNPLFVRVKTP